MSDKKILSNDLLKDKELSGFFEEITGLSLSKDALNKLYPLKTNLLLNDLKQLKKGVKKAANKGSEISSVVVNNLIYIVSIKNMTIITVLNNVKNKTVIENIDSVIFMK